jgi:hypothetical protein
MLLGQMAAEKHANYSASKHTSESDQADRNGVHRPHLASVERKLLYPGPLPGRHNSLNHKYWSMIRVLAKMSGLPKVLQLQSRVANTKSPVLPSHLPGKRPYSCLALASALPRREQQIVQM